MAGRSVFYVKYLVPFYVLRTPVYIWNRIAGYTHFILFWSSLEISESKVHLSIMSLKFRCQARHPLSEKYSQIYTQNTVDGKEDFITNIIAPRGVNKTDKTPQGSPEFAYELPFFIYLFFYISLPWGLTARLQPFANIWQSKRVGIIAIKNKKNANTLLRDVFTAIAVVVSVDEWWK